MAIRMGRWDCPYCGQVGNLGPEIHCASCGKPRGKNVQFYLTEDAAEVADESELAAARAGANWICNYCGASNTAGKENCRSCGNQNDQDDSSLAEKTYYYQAEKGFEAENNSLNFLSGCRNKILLGLVIFIILIIWMGRPKIERVTITGFAWERTIQILTYREVTHEDWVIPDEARVLRNYSALHHYEKVFDHYETHTRKVKVKVGEEKYVSGQRDLGNGYFEDIYDTRPVYEYQEEEYREKIYRKVPVYQRKYVYNIYEWVLDRTATATATDQKPYWPEGAPPSKDWRDGVKIERYYLVAQDKKQQQHQIETDLLSWERFRKGQRVKVKSLYSGKKVLADKSK